MTIEELDKLNEEERKQMMDKAEKDIVPVLKAMTAFHNSLVDFLKKEEHNTLSLLTFGMMLQSAYENWMKGVTEAMLKDPEVAKVKKKVEADQKAKEAMESINTL